MEDESGYVSVPSDADEKAFDDAVEVLSGKSVGEGNTFRAESPDDGAVVLQQNGNVPESVKNAQDGAVNAVESAPSEPVSGDNSAWLDGILNAGRKNMEDANVQSAKSVAEKPIEQKPVADSADDLVNAVLEEMKGDPKFKSDMEIFGDDYRKQGKVAEAIVRKVLKGMNIDRVNAAADHLERMEQESIRNDWERQVNDAIPNWQDIINHDSRFPEWFDRQSERTKDCLRTASTADDAIFALRKFQFDVGQRSNTIDNMRSVYGNPANEQNTTRYSGDDSMEKSEEELFNDAVNAVYKGRPRG